MPYKHGVSGLQAPTTDTLPPSGVATLPVYIGTAPVHKLSNSSSAINTPILVNSFDDAMAKVGYSDDWNSFTLCEAIYAHFKNRIQPMGPIVLINVLDPQTHFSSKTASVAITNGVGYLTGLAKISSIVITGKTLNTDYTVEYTTDDRVKITALPGKTLTNPTSVAYDEIDITKVVDTDVIGGITNNKRTGISVVELVYQQLNQIPTILAAPRWSQKKTIKDALVAKAQKINGHWDALVVADLDSSTNTTIAAASAWKDTNGYSDVGLKVGWPKASSAGKVFCASTLITLRMQQTDAENGNVPYVSPSNKRVDITSVVLADGTDILFDEMQANELNQNGITTFTFRGGMWVLWGPHCANYKDGSDIDQRDVFDASIRMMRYMTNSFQERYMQDVDGPLNRSTVDTILNDAGTWINSLVADGKLLYGSISFNETSNPTTSVVEGDFVFDISTTTTPVAKSMTFVVQYTTKGIDTLFGGES